jgi:hypothetical protein
MYPLPKSASCLVQSHKCIVITSTRNNWAAGNATFGKSYEEPGCQVKHMEPSLETIRHTKDIADGNTSVNSVIVWMILRLPPINGLSEKQLQQGSLLRYTITWRQGFTYLDVKS